MTEVRSAVVDLRYVLRQLQQTLKSKPDYYESISKKYLELPISNKLLPYYVYFYARHFKRYVSTHYSPFKSSQNLTD
jgi:hypothetical protein